MSAPGRRPWNAAGWGALTLAFAASAAAQTTIRVPLHYTTIQQAISAAANGDTVLVAPGTYVENINFLGKAITVTSEAGPETTIIDGNDVETVVKFRSGEQRTSVFSGFTVLNGRSTHGAFGEGGGIGVFYSSPTITGNIIAKNRACEGAGIVVYIGSALSGSPVIQRNTIINNRQDFCSGGGGAGIFVLPGAATPPPPPVEILDNVISGNNANNRGGGIMARGNTLIRGNLITDNFTADHNCAGGGIYAERDVTIVQNVVAGNRARCGAGIYLTQTPSGYVVANNTVVDNDAYSMPGSPGQGSGIYYHLGGGPGGLRSRPRGNLIVARSGQAAVYCDPYSVAPIFEHNNVFAPSGMAYGGSCTDQSGGNANISEDPLFVDQPGRHYRLQPGSPSLDIGGDPVPLVPVRDAEGNARIADGDGNGTMLLDHGAYERAAFLTPQFHDFGSMILGSASVSQTFSLLNLSAATLSISSISLGPRAVGAGGYSEFSVTPGGSDPCPSLAPVLSPGGSCTVMVTFTPSAILGRKGATLRVVSDSGGSPHIASLSAAMVIDSAIVSKPLEHTTSTTATFTFAANVEGATFECKRENAVDFTPCSNPVQYDVTLGPHTLQVRARSWLGDLDPTAVTYAWTVVPRGKRADFGRDGKSDIVWRNSITGENYRYPMDGTQVLETEGYLRTVADQYWQIVGVGDFDGDGVADLLWRHAVSGENYIYFMDGNVIKPSEGYIRTIADLNWRVAGVGDFDNDGRDDILWRHAVTGENYLYLMDGLTIKPGEGYLRTVADTRWEVKAVADLSGDLGADILWRHKESGENYYYLMYGRAIGFEGYLRTVPDVRWEIAGVGRFNSDFRADIVWRHSESGENYFWPMVADASGIRPQIGPTEGHVRTVPDPQWRIVAVGDYDGDGKSDLFWRHSTTGENYVFPMDGIAIKPNEGYVRTVPPGSWNVAVP